MTEFYLGIHERTSDLDIFPTHYQLSDNYYVGCMVGLCGCMAVSLICWALWLYGRQSDMLGFVAVWPSV